MTSKINELKMIDRANRWKILDFVDINKTPAINPAHGKRLGRQSEQTAEGTGDRDLAKSRSSAPAERGQNRGDPERGERLGHRRPRCATRTGSNATIAAAIKTPLRDKPNRRAAIAVKATVAPPRAR